MPLTEIHTTGQFKHKLQFKHKYERSFKDWQTYTCMVPTRWKYLVWKSGSSVNETHTHTRFSKALMFFCKTCMYYLHFLSHFHSPTHSSKGCASQWKRFLFSFSPCCLTLDWWFHVGLFRETWCSALRTCLCCWPVPAKPWPSYLPVRYFVGLFKATICHFWVDNRQQVLVGMFKLILMLPLCQCQLD